MKACTVVCLGFLGAMLNPAPARSADAQSETRLREALRSATTQLRGLEDERARWQATDAEQKKEIESLKTQLAAAQNKVRREQAPSPELTRRLEEQTEANQKLAASLSECQAAAAKAAEATRSKDEQSARLTAQLNAVNQRAAACEEKNARLYQLTRDFVQRFEKQGIGDALLGTVEPFFGFKRVQLENFSQDLQDKLLEQKAQP